MIQISKAYFGAYKRQATEDCWELDCFGLLCFIFTFPFHLTLLSFTRLPIKATFITLPHFSFTHKSRIPWCKTYSWPVQLLLFGFSLVSISEFQKGNMNSRIPICIVITANGNAFIIGHIIPAEWFF